MSKPLLAWMAIGLIVATPALAQMGGGGGMGGQMGGGGGGGHGGGKGRGGTQSSQKPASQSPTGPALKVNPTNQIEIIGVVKAIDAATNRLTIAYDEVEELNWPHGTMPFPVSNEALLKDVKVGEKVRFKVEEHEIYEIKPF